MNGRFYIVALAAGLLCMNACQSSKVTLDDSDSQTEVPEATPNVLLLIADDFGIESSVCYSDSPSPSPRLEALCDEAVVFDNVWSSPICSPTRAGMLTGRHSFRTGIGEQLTGSNNIQIASGEWTIPRVLDAAATGYAHASFGKWHLGGEEHYPTEMGWGHYSGMLSGAVSDYESWTKVTNGVSSSVKTYTTTEIVDDTIEWIDGQTTPWFAWVAFNAPHTPYHLPPPNLHTQNLSGTTQDIEANPKPYFDAAVESLDTEIGRLLDSLDEDARNNTTVIFIGDNGTHAEVSAYGSSRSKGTLHEGGVQVPMMIWGAAVESGGRRSSALSGTVDLFATILELAGVDVATIIPSTTQLDSKSLLSSLKASGGAKTKYLLSELYGTVTSATRQGKTIRDAQHKLLSFSDGRTRFYDLDTDPTGVSSINASNRDAEQQAAFELLELTLQAWTVSPSAPRPE